MKRIGRLILIVPVLFGCIGCDQVTKNIARNTLAGSGVHSFLGDVLRLQYAENPGGFLSLGANIPAEVRPWFFTLLVGVILLVLAVYLFCARKLERQTTLALTLILAGGLGNLFDRICHQGLVVDFLNLGLGPFRTGIFNVADIAITAGIAWLAWRQTAHSSVIAG